MLHLSWFPLVLIYILTNSISKILQKRIMDKKCMDPSAFSSIFQFNAGIFTIPFIFMEPLKLAGSIHVWLVVGLSCLCFTFCMVFYYYGLKRVEMSQAETIATTRSIWMMFFGIVFLGEAASWSKLIGGGMIFIAIAGIYWTGKTLNGFSRGHAAVAAYAVVIGIAFACDKYAMGYFSAAFYQFFIYIVPGIITPLIFPGTVAMIKQIIAERANWGLLLLTSFIQAISTLCMYNAYRVGGDLSVVGPMGQTTIIITITYGIVFMHERWNLNRKIIGAVLAFAGILVLKFM